MVKMVKILSEKGLFELERGFIGCESMVTLVVIRISLYKSTLGSICCHVVVADLHFLGLNQYFVVGLDQITNPICSSIHPNFGLKRLKKGSDGRGPNALDPESIQNRSRIGGWTIQSNAD